jgi:bifunctional non-homologous end joining protein LigD
MKRHSNPPSQTAQLGFVPPLIPVLVEKPPAGDGWLHEIKHDGYRTRLIFEGPPAR